MTRLSLFVFALLSIWAAPIIAPAQDTTPPAQVAWRLLDYLAVDYPGAVADGKVTSTAEYAEMVEFSASVRERISQLPPSATRARLITEAEAVQAAIARRAPSAEVARLARGLGARILAAYPTPLAPAQAPNVGGASQLYQEQCSTCHGVTGRADGPGSRGLGPPPIAFADGGRARDRSVFGLYQVMTQGLDGTAMASFNHLPANDRWALAFYISQLSYTDRQAQEGERLWRQTPEIRARFTSLQALSQVTPAELASQIGEGPASAVMAYLRRHPEAITQTAGGDLSVVRTRLAAAVEAYRAGRQQQAKDLALSAYLDGFEPVEPALRGRDAELLTRVEVAMGDFRAAISRGDPPAEIERRALEIDGLISEAEQALAPDSASFVSTFLSAFTILLREGLEALLIVVAMIAFLRKADRRDVLPYVHGGWIVALAAGVLTWWVATYLVSISGANRELTEGIGGVVSALVLVSVGVWMHGKSQADVWQAYIREKLSAALSKKSAWFLFLLAFIVVYREVFETVLFFTALWSQGGAAALLAGAGAAVAVLAVLAWVLLFYSARLPISEFFRYSALLIAVLAVVLMGKGMKGLQEAGMIGLQTVAGAPRIELLGIYPTVEGLSAQVVVLLAVIVGFWLTGRRPRPQPGS